MSPPCGSSRCVDWWPPASTPWTQTAWAPAHCAFRASWAEVTVTTVNVPAAANASRTSRAGQPKVKETTGTGSSSRIATFAS
ncbi:hypothetical protein GA0115235_10798 [Streptomyces sp. DpondAA-F4a]|nr:hypothetical protein GA0115235_10798 [Streptomyces sp. DpondAA-F4a]